MYSLFLNFSLSDTGFMKSYFEPIPVDNRLLQIKNSVDNGIMKSLARSKGIETKDIPEIELTTSTYPLTPDRTIKGSDPISMMGSFFLILGPIMTFAFMLGEIVREKELKLR